MLGNVSGLADDAYWKTEMLRLVGFVLILAPAAWGWGREGHAIMGAIAERHLTPEARAAVARLLEPGETLASVGSWADEVRGERRETSTWHYINLPVTEPRGDWRARCPQTGCVISIIPEMMGRLRDPALDRAAKAEALKFLIHFVADLHQPLHTGDRGDRGGNDVAVVFRDRPSNLHSVWDTPILLWMMEQDPALRGRLVRGVSYWTRRRMQQGSVEDWAWEAHSISRDVAYRNLPAGDPAVLGEDYARAVAPVIERQLQRGGVRLARLLNEVLGR
jgi:hypothetical protein